MRTKKAWTLLVAVMCVVILAGMAMAAVPQTMNYQGYLTDSGGTPVTGPVNLTFALYSASSGGPALWTETHNGAAVTNGVYSVMLGNGSPTPSPIILPFDAQYYLGVTVGTDPEMSPRQALTVSPYVFRAAIADSLNPAAPLTLSGSLTLPETSATSTPVIMSGTETLLHTYGTENTFVGVRAGNLSMTGTHNTATGYTALLSNTTGYWNTAYGRAALYKNTEGHHNTAMGMQALAYNTTGSFNTATGQSALWQNTIGEGNSAFGLESMFENMVGGANTAVGQAALRNNIASWGNVALGSGALVSHGSNPALTGEWDSYNTAVGYNALYDNDPSDTASGKYNTALGVCAGARCYPVTSYGNETGANNTFVGAFSGLGLPAQLTNATAIGYKAQVNQSNSLVLGGTGTEAVKVGIGTKAPAYALDVVGDIRSTTGVFIGDGSSLVNVNAATATMLAANPTDCPAGAFAIAINAYGNLTCAWDGSGLGNVNAAKLGGQTAAEFAASSHTHTGGQITSTVASATSADFLDGYHAGNAAGNVAVNNGVLNSTLNADLLDGSHASAFATSDHAHYAVNWTGADPNYGLRVENTNTSGKAIEAAGGNYGVYSTGASIGVYAYSATGIGVVGASNSAAGFGLYTPNNAKVDGNLTVGGTIKSTSIRSLVFGVADIQYQTGTIVERNFNGSYSYLTSASGYGLYAMIPLSVLPDGATVTDAECTVTDNSASYQMAFTVNECSPSGTCAQKVSPWCYSGAAGGCVSNVVYASASTNTLNPTVTSFVTNRANYSYNISVWTSDAACGASCKFHSCKVTFHE